ncbi:hypothetical protein AX15_007097 [Amanita polypyramis BW_CC]|nr:hypothetical protein AX15_007097 [Amanita polypyramis BW_CC]
MDLLETGAGETALDDAIVLFCIDVEGLLVEGLVCGMVDGRGEMGMVDEGDEDALRGVWVGGSVPLVQVIGGGRKQLIDTSVHDWLTKSRPVTDVTPPSHMDLSLRALKVADLRHILNTAAAPPPARTTKADLIARILANQHAIDTYYSLHHPEPPTPEPPTPAKQASPPPPIPPSPADPDLDRRNQRVERFGISPTSVPEATPIDPELEKRKKRAERFGIPLVDPKTKNSTAKNQPVDEAEKLKARADRFRAANNTSAGRKRPVPAETVDGGELERRRKRAERFGLAERSV